MPQPKNKEKWDKITIIKSAKKFNFKSEWKANEAGAFLAAKRIGVYEEATNHMLKKPPIQKWTKKRVEETALKFKILSHWKKTYPGAFEAAYRKGYLKEITNHMIDGRKQKYNQKWDEKMIMQSTSNFRVLTHWRKANQGAYTAAYRRGILEKVKKNINKQSD